MQPAQRDWSELPQGVTATILQHVSLQHRFSACALVSSAWAAAAAAVPVTTLSTERPTAAPLKAAWKCQARSFAPQLTRLCLQVAEAPSRRTPPATAYPILQLPCPGLRGLELKNVAANLAQSAADPADSSDAMPLAPLATGLTRLELNNVVLLGQAQQRLAAMSVLTGLQHLTAHNVQHARELAHAFQQPVQPREHAMLLPDGLLPHLQQLTYLHLQHAEHLPAASAAGMQDLSRLTGLRHLSLVVGHADSLYDTGLAVPDGLAALTQLTHLSLELFDGSSLPNLEPLAALQQLSLTWCGELQCSSLVGLTGLQRVDLINFSLGTTSDTLALTFWLDNQQHLTALVLLHLDEFILNSYPDLAAVAVASLMSSSTLQELTLDYVILPTAWELIFPAGELCTALTSLELACFDGPANNEPWERIAAACPNLQRLKLTEDALYPDLWPANMAPITELQSLTGLTYLALHGVRKDAVPQLTQLTMLQELFLPVDYAPEGVVEQLTVMQQLRKLSVVNMNKWHDGGRVEWCRE